MSKYSRKKLLRLEVQKRLAALNRVDLKRISDREIERQVRSLLGIGYVTRPLYLNNPNVYRVRVNRDVECFNTVQELWYPKPEFVLRRGRCNEANTPVLYCADSEGTAIIEVRPDIGDLLTVLEISLKDPQLLPPVCATLARVENKIDDTHYTVGILKQSKSIAKDGTIEWAVPKLEHVRLTASAN